MSALADWLAAHAAGHVRTHPSSVAQRRALDAIGVCRTPALGGRVYRCTSCERMDFAYHPAAAGPPPRVSALWRRAHRGVDRAAA